MSFLIDKFFNFLPLSELRKSWYGSYQLKNLKSDCLAGLAVSIIAIPLAMALAIAVGATPQQGLYTVIIAAPIIALLGGSRFSVSGPTAAFIIILFPVIQHHGMQGLWVASIMAGIILVLMGVAKLGRFIEFIPYPVTIGFTSGIGVVIASLQVKDFLGLSIEIQPSGFIERIILLIHKLPLLNIHDFYIGGITLLVMIVWPKFKKSLPSHLIAILIGSGVATAVMTFFPEWQIETIGSRFHGIPETLPSFSFPWDETFNLKTVYELIGPSFAIAILAAIESLLCASVLDGMTGTKHHSNAELIAQGVGNIIVPFFGGITATSAIARSVVNLRAGAYSPLAAILHGLFVLLAVVCFAPLFFYLPMASLAALLLVTAWNICDVNHFIHILKIGPKRDIIVLITCFALTIFFDMVAAITVGVVLATLLFMNEIANLTRGSWLLETKELKLDEPLPEGVMIYEISGPLFFGVAEKAMRELKLNRLDLKTVILHLGDVPSIDISGIVALKSAIDSLLESSISVILAQVRPKLLLKLKRAGIHPINNKLIIASTLHSSLMVAKKMFNINTTSFNTG